LKSVEQFARHFDGRDAVKTVVTALATYHKPDIVQKADELCAIG
jgi:hypothetical protein